MVGFMLMAARAASLVTDPAVGLWIDRRPAGRQALPLLRAGIAPFMVLVVLTFVPLPRGWSMLARGIGASIGYMGLCVAYGVVNTAYGVMTSLITAAPDMRLRLATSRMVGATLGGLAISIVTLPAVDWLGHGSRQVGFALFMAGCPAWWAGFCGCRRGSVMSACRPMPGKSRSVPRARAGRDAGRQPGVAAADRRHAADHAGQHLPVRGTGL
ncbi:MFS transporter [Komagataeibacter rhaeticus]|nr:MFS transporter [Komagataeibacter rhaeticus]